MRDHRSDAGDGSYDPTDPANWMIITPSYRGDIAQFKLLAESVDRFAPPGMNHQVFLDKGDVALFKAQAPGNYEIKLIEDMLPGHTFQLRWPRSVMLSSKLKPLRGWMLQQIVKLQAAATCERPFIAFVDSDVVFLKPFDIKTLSNGGLVNISRVHNWHEDLPRWRANCAALLGLEAPEAFPEVNFVTALVPWKRDVAAGLLAHIEARFGRPWMSVLASQRSISEYTLYGIYAEEILGLEKAGLTSWDDPTIKFFVDEPMNTVTECTALIEHAIEGNFGAMFHSKSPMQREALEVAVKNFWGSGKQSSRAPESERQALSEKDIG